MHVQLGKHVLDQFTAPWTLLKMHDSSLEDTRA